MLYHLPKNLRHHLARPIGELFDGSLTETRPKVDDWLENQIQKLFPISEIGIPRSLIISCVGDVITESLLTHPRWQKHLKYCFIDGGTQRGAYPTLKIPPNFQTQTLTNPAGSISDEVITFLKATYLDDHQYIVNIVGEEDLLVIPLILVLTQGLILYGQPPITDLSPPVPAGCVGLHIDSSLKEEMRLWFDQFIPEKKK
ncbi:MAG: DUF359 domain-containing protein [Promethearchaeota archaeon]